MSDQIKAEENRMNTLAALIDRALNPHDGPPTACFVLLVAHFDQISGGRVNYVSNGQRDTVVAMMKEYIARYEGRYDPVGGNA